MSVTHPETICNALCNLVVDQLDEVTPARQVRIADGSRWRGRDAVFGNPAFGNAAGGVANANTIA